MERAPRTLAELLAPIAADEFLSTFLGNKFLYCPGQPGKFAGLLPWADLNAILQHHRLDVPRLRLMRDGKAIPPESFLQYRSNKRRADRIPRLRFTEITRLLRDGATLIVDSVDELQQTITELAANLEQVFCNRIQVNLYASWRSSPGFDLHWDGHDVLVLQVSGRKHWKVYPMTREHPLPDDSEPCLSPPQTPLWEGTLENGDTLYIPRGWWHVAVPVDEPTLHLTVGLHNANGVDFLSWFTGRLRAGAFVRQDLPRFGSAAKKAHYLQSVQEAWMQAWNPGLLDQYFEEIEARRQPRPHFSLPWAATPAVLPMDGLPWSVKWIAARSIDWEKSGRDDVIVIKCHGKQWTFAAAARPLLKKLQQMGTCSENDLCASTAGTLSREVVRSFVKELVTAGLAAVVTDGGQR
ncbi:MAG TPA: cupin domain-containing protein [Bryobacteraceae bacterium]|nr:cupin domain-containing protein [Bryobacteraceae bacterium]